MKFLSPAATSAPTPSCAQALAPESRVRIDDAGRGLVGILNVPDGVANPPIVLMLHGFTGQKDELPVATVNIGLFAYTAKRLAESGIASLRIDFHGSGESDGQWEDTTLTGQIGDAVLAFDYLQTLASVNGSKIGILGYSQGGLVGSHLAAARPEAACVVLWAPVTNPLSTYGILMGRDTLKKARSGSDQAVVSVPLSWGGETTLKGTFFKQLPLMTPIGVIGRYPGPLRVIVGRRETVVTPQPATGQSLLDYHDGIQDLVEIDSDHDWNAGTTTTTVDDVLIPKTVEWFKAHF